jgi:hypothetical protein
VAFTVDFEGETFTADGAAEGLAVNAFLLARIVEALAMDTQTMTFAVGFDGKFEGAPPARVRLLPGVCVHMPFQGTLPGEFATALMTGMHMRRHGVGIGALFGAVRRGRGNFQVNAAVRFRFIAYKNEIQKLILKKKLSQCREKIYT